MRTSLSLLAVALVIAAGARCGPAEGGLHVAVDGELVPGVDFDRLTVTATSTDGTRPQSTTLEVKGAELAWPMTFNFLSGSRTATGSTLEVVARAWLGSQAVSIAVGHAELAPGSGASLDLFVARTGNPDAGDGGSEPPDGGEPADASVDAGSPDGGTPDAGPADGGPDDAGSIDAGPEDAGPADAGEPVDAGPPVPTFYRGINFNGGVVTINGNVWQSYTAALNAGLTTNATGFVNSNHSPTPPVGPDIYAMLNTCIWFNNDNLTVGIPVPNDGYEVYLWVLENYASNARSFDVRMEGALAASNLGTFPYPEWRRYGPYPVTVSDGVLNLEFVDDFGDPHIMGLELYR